MSTFRLIRGDDRTLSFDIAADITGVDIRFTAKRSKDDLDDDAVLSKTIGDGITVVSEDLGTLTVTIDAADTEGLTRRTKLYYDLQTSAAGVTHTLDEGLVVINTDISRTSP